MDTASSPIRRLVSSLRTPAILLACALLLGCESSSPAQSSAAATRTAHTEPATPTPAAPSPAPEPPAPVWPQEDALPEALTFEPEVFGAIEVAPGAGANVCNIRFEIDPAAPDVLQGTLLPDGVDNPMPGVNVRHDEAPTDGLTPWYRVGRQRYAIPGRDGDTFEVYLDRTPWEGAIDETWPALAPAATSTVWLSTAGRLRATWGDLALSLVTGPAPRDKAPDAPYRWRAELQVEPGDGTSRTLSLPRDQGRDIALPDGHIVRVDELQLGRDNTLAEATGEVLTPNPVPTLHVRVTVRRD